MQSAPEATMMYHMGFLKSLSSHNALSERDGARQAFWYSWEASVKWCRAMRRPDLQFCRIALHEPASTRSR